MRVRAGVLGTWHVSMSISKEVVLQSTLELKCNGFLPVVEIAASKQQQGVEIIQSRLRLTYTQQTTTDIYRADCD